jgi:hypothetical protein|tara:strand:- start:371 stop:526 length:156 start_codon:yes stop_codon:yes gene_type:complete
MAQFKSSKLKTIMHGRKMIKFDVNGEYITSDKDEIKVIQSASGVEELKKPR